MIRRALLSVSDKSGLIEFARALVQLDVELLSTGGTFRALRDAGLKVTEVSEHTGFPEMMDGRVKTLHPKIHGGLLGRRGIDDGLMEAHDIAPIDLLVVNLYPFEQTVARPDCTLEQAIENIDIGGPAMVRSAAKNWLHVAVLTDPAQYGEVMEELSRGRELSRETRYRLSVAAFNRIASYDAAISNYLSALQADGSRSEFSAQSNGSFIKVQDLRYGENPHQSAAFYRDLYPAPGSLVLAEQLQGKELSYNNIADADAAWECVKTFDPNTDGVACVIVKHANPCGVALGTDAAQAYQRALATDPTSAFGGIVAFNVPVDAATVQAIGKLFMEVLIAPGYSEEALEALKPKANSRILRVPLDGVQRNASDAWSRGQNAHDVKRVGSGLLIQTSDNRQITRDDLKIVSKRAPSPGEIEDLLFAFRIAKFVKSNAIVYARNLQTIGVGAGQMSRVYSAKIAGIKAADEKLEVRGSVMASDAFFPFRDGIDAAAAAGIAAVIQPGGSMRDAEVIAAADEAGMAMVFTGVRHFRH